MKIQAVLVLFLVLFSSNLVAQEKEQSRRAGYYWKGLSFGEKISYLEGILDYRGYVNWRTEIAIQTMNEVHGLVERMDKEKAHKLFGAGRIIEAPMKDLNIGGKSYGQVIDGLDEFYKDYRNLRIEVLDALTIVRLELSGAPPEEIQERKRVLRMPPEDAEKYWREYWQRKGMPKKTP